MGEERLTCSHELVVQLMMAEAIHGWSALSGVTALGCFVSFLESFGREYPLRELMPIIAREAFCIYMQLIHLYYLTPVSSCVHAASFHDVLRNVIRKKAGIQCRFKQSRHA